MEEKLIAVVKKYPITYSTKHPDYLRTKSKDEAWEKIGAKLGVTGTFAKEKWTKLRDNHREALRRQKKKKGLKVEPYRNWIYQKEMEFLLPFMKIGCRANVDSTTLEETGEQFHGIEDELTNRDWETDNEVKTEVSLAKTKKTSENVSDSEECFVKEKEDPTKKNFKPSIHQFPGKCEKSTLIRDQLRQQESSTEQKKNALHLFFTAMYMTANELPPVYQRKIRKKIFDIVTQAEEEYESELSRSLVNRGSKNYLADQYPQFFPQEESTMQSSLQVNCNVVLQDNDSSS